MADGLEVISEDFDYGNNIDMALTASEILTTKKLTWANDKNPIEIPAGAMGLILENLGKDYLIAFYDHPYTLPINKNKVVVGIGNPLY